MGAEQSGILTCSRENDEASHSGREVSCSVFIPASRFSKCPSQLSHRHLNVSSHLMAYLRNRMFWHIGPWSPVRIQEAQVTHHNGKTSLKAYGAKTPVSSIFPCSRPNFFRAIGARPSAPNGYALNMYGPQS